MGAWQLLGTGNGAVAAHGAVADMQWGGCGHWGDGAAGQGCLDLFGAIWVCFEYTRAVLEYIRGDGSCWAPAMGRLLHMGRSQTCSGVVVVSRVTTRLQQPLHGVCQVFHGLPGSVGVVFPHGKYFFEVLVSYLDLFVKSGPK